MVEIKQESTHNGYTVNLKQNNEISSEPGPREKYSVVIEPERVKKVPVVIEYEPVRKGALNPVEKEATLPVHLVKREVIVKPGPVKEVVVPIHEVKQVKTDKEEEKREVKKPSRGFFGRKEKVKIEDSKAKLERIEEAKK